MIIPMSPCCDKTVQQKPFENNKSNFGHWGGMVRNIFTWVQFHLQCELQFLVDGFWWINPGEVFCVKLAQCDVHARQLVQASETEQTTKHMFCLRGFLPVSNRFNGFLHCFNIVSTCFNGFFTPFLFRQLFWKNASRGSWRSPLLEKKHVHPELHRGLSVMFVVWLLQDSRTMGI